MLRIVRPLVHLEAAAQPSFRRTINSSIKPSVRIANYNTLNTSNQRSYAMLWKSTTVSWTGTTKMMGFMAATTGTMTSRLWTKQPLSCQASYTDPSAIEVKDAKDADARKTLVHKGEISFGVVLGFCTGYLIKKVGKLFALMVGAGFMFLQYLSFNGFITIHWERLEGSYNRRIGVDKDGKVTTQTVRSKWKGFVGFLTHNIQFKSTFMVGLYGGLRYG